MTNLLPLRKKTVEGILYERRPETEVLIHTCLQLSFEDVFARAEISDRNSPDYIPSEVLVYFLRQTRSHNSDTQFNALYQLLEKRIKRVCPRTEVRVKGEVGDVAMFLDLQDFVLDYFTELVLRDRQEYEEKFDIFEYAFDHAIARRKQDALRKMYRRDKPTEPLEYDENGDIPSEVEKSLAELNPDTNSIEDEITYRFQLQQAIDSLPPDERRVITMILARIPSESANPKTQTIAKLLGCGPQTVRNRRDRAVKKLKERLGTEVKHVN